MRKEEYLKEEKGITLLALVVTIIVLLILAGVSLNLVAGSNGILRRATTAVKTTNEKAIEEKLQMTMMEMQMDYYADGMQEGSFANYLKAHDVYNLPSGEMFSFEVNDDNTVNIQYYSKSDNDTPDMEFSFDLTTNEIALEASGGEIKPGRTKSMVTYDANGGTGTVPASQKVLQGTNVKVDTTTTLTKQGYNFLGWALSNTATSAISNFKMPESDVTLYAVWQEWPLATEAIAGANYGDKVNYSANGVTDWKIFSKDGDNIYLITGDVVEGSKLNASGTITINEKFVYTTDNTNTTLVNWMTDTSNWSNFVNSAYADQATGGPTLAQLAASVNEKLGTNYDEDTIKKKNLKDVFYNINKAWWLNSLYSDNTDDAWYVSIDGNVHSWHVNNVRGCSIRPLVQLKSSVKANWNGTAWDLSN